MAVMQIINSENRARILIVEDDNLMMNLLIDMLSSSYAISQAGTVQEALERSYHDMPDLILCDLKLPDGSGLTILETLKDDETTSHIPIMVISSCNSQQDILTGLEHGADDYVSKPFSNSELQFRIRSQLENRQRMLNWCRNQMLYGQSGLDNDLPSKEQQFIERLRLNSEQLLKSSSLSVESLASKMAHSKRQLQRKVREYLSCSCSEYIFALRMSYARSLDEKGYTTKEIAAMVGYKDVAHFRRIFKEYLEATDNATEAS